MKSVVFIPSICKGDEALFSGEVELRLPTFDEKFEYLEKTGIEFDDGGLVEVGTTPNKIKFIREIVKLSEKHYIRVSLKDLNSNEEFKSFEDLQYCTEAHPLLMEVATALLNGFKLGNG